MFLTILYMIKDFQALAANLVREQSSQEMTHAQEDGGGKTQQKKNVVFTQQQNNYLTMYFDYE